MKINPTKCVIVPGMGKEFTGRLCTMTEIALDSSFQSGVKCRVTFDGSTAKKQRGTWLDFNWLVAVQ